MQEDTWGRWAVVGIVAALLGWSVALVAAGIENSDTPVRAVFLGIMSGIAFVTLALGR